MRAKWFWAALPLLLLTSVCLAQNPAKWVIVTGDKCNFRSGPESSSETVKALPKFTPLKLLGNEKNDYFEAQTIDGKKGWAHKTVIGDSPFVSVKSDNVNVRTGPSQENDIAYIILLKLYPLRVIGRQNEYVKVIDYEDDSGWVHESYLSAKHYCIVKVEWAEAYAGAGRDYEVVLKAQKGTFFEVVKQEGDWVEVRHEDGGAGWIPASSVWGASQKDGDETEKEKEKD